MLTIGEMLPMRVTVPPLRTLAIEAAMVSSPADRLQHQVYTFALRAAKDVFDQGVAGK